MVSGDFINNEMKILKTNKSENSFAFAYAFENVQCIIGLSWSITCVCFSSRDMFCSMIVLKTPAGDWSNTYRPFSSVYLPNAFFRCWREQQKLFHTEFLSFLFGHDSSLRKLAYDSMNREAWCSDKFDF